MYVLLFLFIKFTKTETEREKKYISHRDHALTYAQISQTVEFVVVVVNAIIVK